MEMEDGGWRMEAGGWWMRVSVEEPEPGAGSGCY